jgi:hypothetical protein
MPDDKKTAENSGSPGRGTPGTPGTPTIDDVGEIEAATTVAEPWPDEGEAGIPRRYPSAVAGLLRASLCRPVSWADATARPSPGSWCRNCEGSGWWGNASGWRCWTCHPPGGLALGTFEEVQT